MISNAYCNSHELQFWIGAIIELSQNKRARRSRFLCTFYAIVSFLPFAVMYGSIIIIIITIKNESDGRKSSPSVQKQKERIAHDKYKRNASANRKRNFFSNVQNKKEPSRRKTPPERSGTMEDGEKTTIRKKGRAKPRNRI